MRKLSGGALFAVGAAVAVLAAVLPGSAGAHNGAVVLNGTGTAVVDGRLAPGEWQNAHALAFDDLKPPHDGGGTVPVTVRAMNDDRNLYFSFEIARGTFGQGASALLVFDNNHDGVANEGDDYFAADVDRFGVTFRDGFDLRECFSGGWCGPEDTDAGGTTDGTAAASANGATTIIEISHPLDDADNSHDFSLSAPSQVIGFSLLLELGSEDLGCTYACYAGAVLPALLHDPSRFGDVVVATDVVPPETEIVAFTDDLTRSATAEFTYDGSDNVTAPDRLSFSCSLDGSAYGPCRETLRVSNGRHRLLARAQDEAGNVALRPFLVSG